MGSFQLDGAFRFLLVSANRRQKQHGSAPRRGFPWVTKHILV